MMQKKFSVFAATCPSHELLDIIGNKWVLLVLLKLSHKTYRFGELQRDIGGISKKVLTSTLQKLEESGLINRQAFDERPLRVEYSISSLGHSLSFCCQSLTDWAESNISQILAYKEQVKSVNS